MAKAKRATMAPAIVKAEAKAREFCRLDARAQTALAAMVAILLGVFPNRKAFANYDVNKAFFKVVKTVSNNGTAYAYARKWAHETYGGMLRKDGSIGGGKGGGMTLGRWNNAFKTQVNAMTDYIGKVPRKDVEPEAMAMIAAMLEHVNALAALEVEFDAYVEAEREAAEMAKAA